MPESVNYDATHQKPAVIVNPRQKQGAVALRMETVKDDQTHVSTMT